IDGVIYIARQIKKNIREAAIPFKKSVCSDYVTTSMGVSTFVPSKEYSSSILLLSADTALYQAKSSGRNKIFIFNTDETVED
ncbi:MAG: diguanylate cyclase, partial [bacterium]|nr:diguanylate cyclase [bacterium]